MYGLKKLIDHIDITVLNTELLTVKKEWNYRNVNNPYSRIYYVTEGSGTFGTMAKNMSFVPEIFT